MQEKNTHINTAALNYPFMSAIITSDSESFICQPGLAKYKDFIKSTNRRYG